ncbi:HesA/MoeB/ThiF family protein [Pontibacter chinhatensis]|uniref:Molybdopterin-synthase adenylyltransferase n=1 Tax=Pontibacter chinhatensis TaxID=1436961 RepID=A0A1I2RHX7_9BACT|nr:HesA/MoeB/ThiF family protein [Pontibacter chinhatensis]SFG40102.1 adenylyltransferase and sulfurtransferase [Pontibacter chinhatensis]
MQNNLLRYTCQIALPGFSEASQQQLQEARVLVVGAGGLGCPAAQYLAAAGIGTLGIADFDVVSVGNLHRQVLFTPEEVGQHKALVACEKLQRQNPGIKLVPHVLKVTSDNILALLQEYDLVLDGTDNFDTKYLLNDACVLAGKPLVYGAIYQFDGQVAVWNVRQPDGSFSPNYRDVYPMVDDSQVPNCAEGGVIPTLAGMIGCMQANEVIKFITKTGDLLAGKLLLVDALSMQSRVIKLGKATKTSISALPQTEEVPTLSVQEVKQQLETEGCVLVDVRNQAERDTYHIGGEHVPLEALTEEAAFLASDKPILIYCASGKRSGEAVKRLKKMFPEKEIYSLEGGMKAWREQV